MRVCLQGHKGKDGRYYLLDFSRTMPPVEPAHGVKNGYLYQLLRPEVLVHPCHDFLSAFLLLPAALGLKDQVY
jgi:hypothetical protein